MLRHSVKQHRTLNAAIRKKIKVRIWIRRHLISKGMRTIARWHTIRSKETFYSYDQDIAFCAQRRRNRKLEGQMATFVRTQLHAIEPDLSQIIDRSETHEGLLLFPSP